VAGPRFSDPLEPRNPWVRGLTLLLSRRLFKPMAVLLLLGNGLAVGPFFVTPRKRAGA
jgi:hypothetical protein